jgi:ribosomal protein S27AE
VGSNKGKEKKVRCPYCVVDGTFQAMKVVVSGRLICGHCGHIVFPEDGAFKCPCTNCVEIGFSPRVRRIRKLQPHLPDSPDSSNARAFGRLLSSYFLKLKRFTKRG